MKKIYIVYGFFWLLAIAFMVFISRSPAIHSSYVTDSQSEFLKGQVIEKQDDIYSVRILGEKTIIKTRLSDLMVQDEYKEGDLVSVYYSSYEDGEVSYDIADYYHFNGLIYIFVIFCLLALFVGRKKGLYSILSVIISFALFYGVILSSVRIGFPILASGIIYIFFITILTIPLIHGFNKKSLSAILAVIAGYLIGFILTFFFVDVAQIGMTPSEEFRTLFVQYPNINIRHILIVSLFLGAVGALIDVAISICSAIFESIEEGARATFARVYKLGMNVGKDILGSMVNTLLIAYLAASLPFLVLMTLSRFNNATEFLNFDFIALELVRIFIGAASIVLIIPITSVIAAYFIQLIPKKIK